MLSSSEVTELAIAIVATAETLGQTLSANAARMMAEDLKGYEKTAISSALTACRRELRGRICLADILDRIARADGRPTSDEAWPIALEAMDEDKTVLMTPEIASALAEARPVLAIGDTIAGRKTFQAAYDRAVHAARQSGIPVRWEISLGRDQELRRMALESAERKGLLPPGEVRARLEHVAPDAAITAEGRAIAGLLKHSGEAPAGLSERMREKLNELRREVAAARERKAEAVIKDRAARSADLERRKKRHADLVAKQSAGGADDHKESC